MAMERHSILAGNCYRDRFGAVFEVKSIEQEQVSFVEYRNIDSGGTSVSQQTVPVAKFIESLEEQVPCPDRPRGPPPQ